MLSIIAGYKTYAMVILLVLHQALKIAGIDVPEQSISITIDTILAVLAGIFRAVARPKVV